MAATWFRIALFNLVLAGIYGVLMRFAFVTEVSWMDFRHIMNGHSHVMMLGWVYMALTTFMMYTFLPADLTSATAYKVLFWATQLMVLSMAVLFPMMGYKLPTIVVLTVFTLLSFIFIWRFLTHLSQSAPAKSLSLRFLRTALFFYVFSTLALGALGYIMSQDGEGSFPYYMAIQFFLHFQFNGWFLFAVLALFFKMLEDRDVAVSDTTGRWFYWLLVVSCFLTYALAIAWGEPKFAVFMTNSLGVTLQLAALIAFCFLLKKVWSPVRTIFSGWQGFLFKVAFGCFVVKILIQTAVVIPYIATIAYTIRNFVIGFLHLMLLGMVTCALLAYAIFHHLFPKSDAWVRLGTGIFLTGFLLSELLLFVQGTLLWAAMGFMPAYYELLFGVSCLMPVGILVLLAGSLTSKNIAWTVRI
jgi:hypothetical protein